MQNKMKVKKIIILTVILVLAPGLLIEMSAKEKVSVNVSAEMKNIKEKNINKKVKAIERLANTKDKTIEAEIIRELKTSKDDIVKSAAVSSLRLAGSTEAVEAVREIFLDETQNVSVRLNALEGLSRLQDTNVGFETVIIATKDKDPLIRKVAAGFLWHNYYANDKKKVKSILEDIFKEDTDQEVKNSVRTMLDFKLKE